MDSVVTRETWLRRRYDSVDAPEFLNAMITQEFLGQIAVVSSFGTESALLLAIVAEINRNVPVIFIDTGKIFPETLDYRNKLVAQLGLTDVRSIGPTQTELDARDPSGELWHYDPDACCRLRKVEPLARAQIHFDALISGRKRYHGALRGFMPRIESVNGKIKLDPLAHWSLDRVETEFEARNLPHHPLRAEGYASVGCEPCTIPVADGADIRSGRWFGSQKTECGIHLPMTAMAGQ